MDSNPRSHPKKEAAELHLFDSAGLLSIARVQLEGRGATRRTRWDRQFESPLLQQRVHCEPDAADFPRWTALLATRPLLRGREGLEQEKDERLAVPRVRLPEASFLIRQLAFDLGGGSASRCPKSDLHHREESTWTDRRTN